MSRGRGVSIGNRLAVTALIALLGFVGDVRQAAAQFAQPGPPFVQPGVQSADNVERATRRPHRVGRAHRKRRAVRAPPNQRRIAEKNGYRPLSELVNFPKFFPGLGILLVKPDTLPLGPFLCFDRNDRLVATVYMVPIKDIDDHRSLEAGGFAGPVDHVSFYFNPGHPAVDMPHYHVVIWHVSKKEEARVAK